MTDTTNYDPVAERLAASADAHHHAENHVRDREHEGSIEETVAAAGDLLALAHDVHDTARYAAAHGNPVDPLYLLRRVEQHLGGRR